MDTSSVLTIATLSHVPRAIVTLQSAREHGRSASCHLFVVDAPATAVRDIVSALGPERAWIDVFGPHDLREERNLFLRSMGHYNALELCCFAKYRERRLGVTGV